MNREPYLNKKRKTSYDFNRVPEVDLAPKKGKIVQLKQGSHMCADLGIARGKQEEKGERGEGNQEIARPDHASLIFP